LADDLVAIGVGSQAEGAAAVPVDVRRASVIYEGHGAAGAGLHVGVAIGAVDQSKPSAGLQVTAPAGVLVVGGRAGVAPPATFAELLEVGVEVEDVDEAVQVGEEVDDDGPRRLRPSTI
jgi:hypothetical protein